MSNVFHIHDVLDFLYQNPGKKSESELQAFIEEKFGKDAQFFSCSVENMNPSDAVRFMKERRKIVEVSSGQYSADPENKCHH